MCVTCLCPLTVSHVIIECTGFSVIHNKHFGASSVGKLFENVDVWNIIDFIKETIFVITHNSVIPLLQSLSC